jgi:hypothetical protein
MNDHRVSPFDMALVWERRKRAVARHGLGHFLLERASADLADRLAATNRPFAHAMTLFGAGPMAAIAIAEARPAAIITQVETDSAFFAAPNAALNICLAASPEDLTAAPAAQDLAVSLLSMQEINDLPGFLVQTRQKLKPDGLFLGCLFGEGTLQELRETLLETEIELTSGASPRVAPFADVRTMGALLQRAGFALPVTDTDIVTVRYANLFGLIADLRQMGLTNALNQRSRRPLGRTFWAKAAELYARRFADADGRLRATFTLMWLSGWAPDASQPEALKPGSAKVSLRDALQAGRE